MPCLGSLAPRASRRVVLTCSLPHHSPPPHSQREALIKAGGVPMGIGAGSTVRCRLMAFCLQLFPQAPVLQRVPCACCIAQRASRRADRTHTHTHVLPPLPQLRNVIVDKNARIGDNVQIINK